MLVGFVSLLEMDARLVKPEPESVANAKGADGVGGVLASTVMVGIEPVEMMSGALATLSDVEALTSSMTPSVRATT